MYGHFANPLRGPPLFEFTCCFPQIRACGTPLHADSSRIHTKLYPHLMSEIIAGIALCSAGIAALVNKSHGKYYRDLSSAQHITLADAVGKYRTRIPANNMVHARGQLQAEQADQILHVQQTPQDLLAVETDTIVHFVAANGAGHLTRSEERVATERAVVPMLLSDDTGVVSVQAACKDLPLTTLPANPQRILHASEVDQYSKYKDVDVPVPRSDGRPSHATQRQRVLAASATALHTVERVLRAGTTVTVVGQLFHDGPGRLVLAGGAGPLVISTDRFPELLRRAHASLRTSETFVQVSLGIAAIAGVFTVMKYVRRMVRSRE